MTGDFDKKTLEMHAIGKKNTEIAYALGITVQRVATILKRNGLVRNVAKGGQREMSRRERVEKIASILKNGLNKEEIAKSMRLSPSSLGNWMSEARAIAFPKKSLNETDDHISKTQNLPRKDGALIPGHPIAVDAMWHGLERWRDEVRA